MSVMYIGGNGVVSMNVIADDSIQRGDIVSLVKSKTNYNEVIVTAYAQPEEGNLIGVAMCDALTGQEVVIKCYPYVLLELWWYMYSGNVKEAM